MRARIIGAAVLVGAALAVVASTASGGTQAASSITVWLQTDAQATNWEPIVKAANAAFQKDHPELSLQALQPLAQRRLDDVLTGRRTPEMQLLGESDEVAELPKLHTRHL